METEQNTLSTELTVVAMDADALPYRCYPPYKSGCSPINDALGTSTCRPVGVGSPLCLPLAAK